MTNSKKGNKKKNKKKNTRLFILLGILLVCVIGASIVLCIYFNDTKYDRLIKKIYNENKEDVDLATNALFYNDEFKEMSIDNQYIYMDKLLDFYENDKKIANVKYNSDGAFFSFKYLDDKREGRTGSAALTKYESDTVEDVIAYSSYKMKYLA